MFARIAPVGPVMPASASSGKLQLAFLGQAGEKLAATDSYIFVFASPASPSTDCNAFWMASSWTWSRA